MGCVRETSERDREREREREMQRYSIYEGGLKSKFRFVITFLFFIVHT